VLTGEDPGPSRHKQGRRSPGEGVGPAEVQDRPRPGDGAQQTVRSPRGGRLDWSHLPAGHGGRGSPHLQRCPGDRPLRLRRCGCRRRPGRRGSLRRGRRVRGPGRPGQLPLRGARGSRRLLRRFTDPTSPGRHPSSERRLRGHQSHRREPGHDRSRRRRTPGGGDDHRHHQLRGLTPDRDHRHRT